MYSNLPYFGSLKYGNIEIHTVDWQSGMPAYILRFDNNFEVVDSTKILVKVGDDEIVRQLKYILSFSLNGIFDENENTVEQLIRTNISYRDNPEPFLGEIVRKDKYITEAEIKFSQSFYKQMMDLKREDYKIVMQCFSTYYSAIKVLFEDMSLSYSMLVYCIEALSSNYDKYFPIWDDYDQEIRVGIESTLLNCDENVISKIKNILIKDKHLKLSKRFVNFVLKNINDEIFCMADRRCITYDELENALTNAYGIRSKYAHQLQPIMKQLQDGRSSEKSDSFEWEHSIILLMVD